MTKILEASILELRSARAIAIFNGHRVAAARLSKQIAALEAQVSK